MKYCWLLCLFTVLACNENQHLSSNVAKDWAGIEMKAKNTQVNMIMWQSDPMINRYMSDYVAVEVQKRFNIELKLLHGQGNEIVKLLMAGIEQGATTSNIDLCWINGETFYQLQQIKALYGPFVNILPNSKWIDFNNPFIKYDFQQETSGYECPWGNVQQCIIYDSVRTASPPQDLQELSDYVHKHPGKFTIPTEFAGMTLLKAWMVALAGQGKAYFDGAFDEMKYEKYSGLLWKYINENKPYYWRKGATFPEKLSIVHQMFANAELDFTFSNNDAEVDNKILQGIFPATSKAYVPNYGTIQNSHFLGIPNGSTNKNAALLVINFLISPEAQFEKMKPAVWGDGTVLDINRLDSTWKNKFQSVPGRKNAPLRSAIKDKAIKEPAPEYMIRLYADFRKFVMNAK